MSSTLLKQADKLTLGLVSAACIAALGDAYVKRVKTVDDGQKIVDAMYTEKQRLETEKPRSSSVHDDQVNYSRITLPEPAACCRRTCSQCKEACFVHSLASLTPS